MKQTRFLHAWHIVMLCLTAWLLPQRVAATHVDDTWKYQVSLNGSNTISIQAPVYDQEGADCWVCDGNLKATWTGDNGKSQTKTVFHWQRNGDTDSSSKDIWIHFRTDVGGSIDVTQGNTSNHFTLTSADGDIQRLVYRNNDGNTYTVYAVWRLPYDMLGKDGKLFSAGHSQGGQTIIGVLRLVTEKHPDIHFTRSFAGGGPYCIPEIYRQFMASNQTAMPSTVVGVLYSYNDVFGLGLSREDIFREPLLSHLDEWLLSKQYKQAEIEALIGSQTVTDFIVPTLMDPDAEPCSFLPMSSPRPAKTSASSRGTRPTSIRFRNFCRTNIMIVQ